MAQYLNLPSGNSILLGEGEDPQQAYIRALKEYPEEFGFQKTSTAKGGFGAAFSAGLSRLGGEAALTAGKLGLLTPEEAEARYKRQLEKARGIFKPTEEGWTEAPFRKLAETAGGSAAYMLAPAAAGVAALAAPVVVPGAAALGTGVIGAGLAGLTGFGQYTGSNLAAQMEEGKKGLAETSGAAAAAAAVPQAALDVLSFRMIPGVKRLFGSVGKEVTEDQAKSIAAQTLRQKIGDYSAATGLAMGVEGATEVAQDMLEKLQAGANLTDPKAREDYLENFIGGAALAGVLGPFGRGFERAGIQARGRQLEKERLDAEARAAADEAAALKLTAPEEALGPEVPAALQTKRLQDRLAQIEQEAAVARQDKDMDTLLRLQRERTALEAQVGEQPTGMEQRQALEKRLAYYQAIEARLLEQAKAAPTAAEKRPVLERLVEVQDQRRQAANALEQQEKQGVIPQLKTQADLLRQEKATINALQKAEDSGDAAAQLKLTNRLADLQEQLGLFGQEAYTAQQRYEQAQAEAKANKPPLLLTDQRRAEPIPMGFNFESFPTPPRRPQDYLQETLFGPAERVAVPATTEMTLPNLQRAVSSLSERSDLSEADRGLLDRVSDLTLPKRGVRTAEGLQAQLREFDALRRRTEQDILNRAGEQWDVEDAGARTVGVYDQEKRKRTSQISGADLTDTEKLAKIRQDAAASPQLQQAGILRLDRRLRAIEKKQSELEAQATKLETVRTPIEKLSTTGAVSAQARVEAINREIEALARGTQEDKSLSNKQRLDRIEQLRQEQARLVPETVVLRQRIADWVSDTSRGLDNTNSRKALEEALLRFETAPRGEKEALTKLKRRIATPEERAALGKKSVLERVPTAVTTTAQQPDLFADTEAQRAIEFETPKEMQEFMASSELQKQREAEAQRGLAKAQEAGPPTSADVQRFQKLLRPTVAFLNKQADKVRGFLKGFNRKLDDYKALLSAKAEQDEEALAKAKRQQAEVLLAIENSLLKQHQQYARAMLELQAAKETFDGLTDFQNTLQANFDTIVKMSDEWAQVAANEKARFQQGLEARQETLRTSLGRLGVLRGEISNKFGDILSMEAPAIEVGAAFDPELVQAYTTAKQAADKALNDFYSYARERQKISTPAQWEVTPKDFRQFLENDARMFDLLEQQALTVKKWARTVGLFKNLLTSAQASAKADPVWSEFLKEAQEAVDAAVEAANDGQLRAPDKLMAAIRSAKTQLNNLKKEASAAAAEQTEQIRRTKNVAAAQSRAAAEARTRAAIRAENERLEREGEAKTRVTFEKQSKKEREAVAELQTRLDNLVEAKRDAMDKKRAQTKHFRLTPEEQKLIASGKKTREQVIDAKREADLEKIAAEFDTVIAKVQAEIRAVRGVAKPSEKREAQLKATLELQRRIGEKGPLETAEEVERIAQRQSQGRTGQTLVNVRTGRVSEGKLAKPTREMTEGQERVEAAEANRLAAAQQAANEEKYRNGLVQYAKTAFDADLSSLDTDALEYEILKLQAEAEEKSSLRRPATAKEQARLAKEAAEGLDNPLNRIISHDYASRENTPLDDKTADAVGKGDLTQALTSLAKNGSTPFVRMVAQRLLPMVENTKLTTESLIGKGGEYDAQTDTVTLNKDALTEEDLLHEAGHAATNTVASYETEGGMTRRQFLKGAVTGLTALKLPNITENMSLAAQEQMFFDMIDAWRGWVRAANKIAPALKLDPYINLNVADRDLRGFLTELEYNEVSDHAVVELLENGGLKKLQSAINASQRAIMAEATKTGEGKAEAQKETFTPTKDQLAARTALEKLYAKMQGRPEFKDEYGNVSFKEFVSELLSNKQVRDKINQTAGLLRRIYEGLLRMLGIEPTTLSDKAVEQAFAMFSPSTANVGKEERLASIMRGVFPGTASDFSDKVPKSITDMVNRTIARNATLGDKIVANLSGLRQRTFIADQWAPVDALRKMGVASGKLKEAQSLQMQVYMRLFSNMQEYTNAALINGVPELRKDKAGIRTIEGGDAKANGATIATALKKASEIGNQQAVERLFTIWMATLRAKQDGIGLDKLNFKSPPTAKELADLDQYLKNSPKVKDAFEEARQLYRQHNRRLLDLQVQTKVMSNEVADDLAKGDYIGFYRVGDNGVVDLMLGGSRPVRVGNVIDQPYLKELVGGDQQILPFFAGMTQNTALLMSMALKNMQHANTAYMFQDLGLGKIRSVPEGKEVPLGKLRFKQDGKDYWFDADEDAFGKMDVPFDLVMQGLQGVKTAVPALVKAMAVPANILRKAVRRIPTYTLRQTVRDPVHGWMTTGGNFVPVLSTWRELYKGMTNPSQTQIDLKEAALISNNVYSGDSEGVTKMLRDLSAEPSKFSQIMMKLDEFAMQGDAATRAVLYDDFRKRGLSHVEALLYTAETMNFSRRGTSASLHWLSHLTPFFNAQIQGLDAVYRALKGDTTFEAKLNARNALLKRGAMLAGVTMAYALMMEDDEAYKNATPEERYGNWFVRVPGTDKTVRVPIPFELGLIFKSIPEAFINVAYGDKKSSEAVKALAKQAYMSSPFGIPTAVKGPLEVAFNYNMYTDQPVETTREQAMDVDQRYRESTTELAKLLGKLGVLSPVQIDHLVRSYTGSAGIMLLSTANMALRPMSGRADVEKPDMSLTEIPVVGTVFQPTTGRGMVNAAFDDVARYQRAAMTYKNLAASDPEAAREYADKFGREIALASMGGSFRQQMGEFAAYKRAIASNPNLTGAQKREQIDAIKKQEIEFAQRLRKLAA